MKPFPLVAAGLGLVVLGLVVWFTAWIAWPIATVLFVAALVVVLVGRKGDA